MAGTRTIVLSLRLDLDYPSASVFSPSSFLSPWAFRNILLSITVVVFILKAMFHSYVYCRGCYGQWLGA